MLGTRWTGEQVASGQKEECIQATGGITLRNLAFFTVSPHSLSSPLVSRQQQLETELCRLCAELQKQQVCLQWSHRLKIFLEPTI